jgi:hypothetical protein
MMSFLRQDPHKFVFTWWGKPIDITLYGVETTLNNAAGLTIVYAISPVVGTFIMRN